MGDLAWFLLATAALQGLVAARLAFEQRPWMRLAAALFGLNALATLGTGGSFFALPYEAVLALDGLTGFFVILIALAYPEPSRHLRRGAAIAAGSAAALVGAPGGAGPWARDRRDRGKLYRGGSSISDRCRRWLPGTGRTCS